MGSALFILCLAAYGVGLYFALRRWHRREQADKARMGTYLPMPNGQSIEVDPDDETDPMHDPDVRAMMAEVIRTGRPMHMTRGEAPTFADDEDRTDSATKVGGGT